MRDPKMQVDEPVGSEFQSSALNNSSTTFGVTVGKQPSLNHAMKRKLGMPKRSGDDVQLAHQ